MNSQAVQALSYNYLILKGILANFNEFRSDKKESFIYRFDCPEFKELREKYRLSKIAGKGDNFERARKLLIHFSRRMTHEPMYDNHVECNALALLDYCYEKPEHGINCLNKSKVLSECCLALGIPARRVSIMPFSPYDLDNHVVTEIYDDTRKKWVMMDPTTGGMFVDEKKTPLSLLEMRERFAGNRFITFIPASSRTTGLEALEKKHLYDNWYICKNSFWLNAEKYQQFGERKDDWMIFVPKGYSINENKIANLKYRRDVAAKQYPEMKEWAEKQLKKAEQMPVPEAIDISALTQAPDLP